MASLDGVTFGAIEEGNLVELRKLNDVTFPVRYNDKFYAEVLATRPEFTKYGACVRARERRGRRVAMCPFSAAEVIHHW